VTQKVNSLLRNQMQKSASSPGDAGPGLVAAERRLAGVLGVVPERWLLVSTHRQRLYLVVEGEVARDYPVSTAASRSRTIGARVFWKSVVCTG